MPQVALRPIRLSDAELCFRWVTDPEVALHLGLTQPPRTIRDEQAWISSVLADPDHLRMFVIEDENARPIGTSTLRGIEPEEGFAFFGILIGERALWDHGYGTAATLATLAFAFQHLGLREVRLSCYSQNQRALRCYEKAGFQPVTQHWSWVPEGGADLRMSITRERWEEMQQRGAS
jgi:RimJ/RimL family protein N-acetyltransferase